MKKNLIFSILIFLLLAQGVLAANEIRVRNNMFITIPTNDFIYIDVVIPDDIGTVGSGEIEYIIQSTADSSWDDLTTQTIRTDMLNTVMIPIQFRTYNKNDGTCSGEFIIILSSAELNKTKTWTGEICVSNYTDIDTKSSSSTNTGMDIANNNFDLFDVAFTPSKKMVQTGSEAEFTLSIETYAELDLTIEPGNELPMTFDEDSISLSDSNPKHDIKVNVTVPNETGDYEFTATIIAYDCEGDFCERTAKGTVKALDAGTDVADNLYTLNIFPRSLNIKNINPIDFEVTIYNPGKEKTLTLELTLPDDMTSNFETTEITVGKGDEERVKFTVTPEQGLGFKIIKFTSTLNEKSKFVTAQISTNEMMSDTLRYADQLLSGASSSGRNQINSALDDWMDEYSNSDYGDEFDEYGLIKDRLSAAEQTSDSGNGPTGEDDGGLVINSEPDDTNPLTNPLILIIIIIVPIAAIAGFFLYRRNSLGGNLGNMKID